MAHVHISPTPASVSTWSPPLYARVFSAFYKDPCPGIQGPPGSSGMNWPQDPEVIMPRETLLQSLTTGPVSSGHASGGSCCTHSRAEYCLPANIQVTRARVSGWHNAELAMLSGERALETSREDTLQDVPVSCAGNKSAFTWGCPGSVFHAQVLFPSSQTFS